MPQPLRQAAALFRHWQGALIVDDWATKRCSPGAPQNWHAGRMHGVRWSTRTRPAAAPLAPEAVPRIGKLYAIEAKLHDLEDASRRREQRSHLASKPDALNCWLHDLQPRAQERRGLSNAVSNTVRRASTLMRILADGVS